VVPLIRSCLGDHGWRLPAAAAARGVVVEGMGGGCLPVPDALGIRDIAARTPVDGIKARIVVSLCLAAGQSRDRIDSILATLGGRVAAESCGRHP
jgi:hypothetical protein